MEIDRLVVGPLGNNCYLFFDGSTRECAVIDPGYNAERILASAGKKGLKIRYIILTHGHFDHILAAGAIKKESGAQVAIHRHDAAALRNPDVSLVSVFMPARAGQAALDPDILLEEGARIGVGSGALEVIHTPGHTPGSICLLWDGALFTGDTLFNSGIGRTDFPGGSEEELMASLRRLFSLNGDTAVYPGHGEPTTLGRERSKLGFA